MLFREGGKALKKDALAPELEAQGVVQIYVKSDILAQHQGESTAGTRGRTLAAEISRSWR
jgi:hypothetical protein